LQRPDATGRSKKQSTEPALDGTRESCRARLRTEDQRLALHALADGVAGVKAEIDRLVVTTGLSAQAA
jgi:hypothetical protein